MSLARRLVPVAGPLVIAAVLAVITSLRNDESPTTEPRALVYSEHPRGLARAEVAAPAVTPPAAPPVDRPRCLARMTVQELGRQLMTMRGAEAIAELYRDQAPRELAIAYLQGLADTAAALAPGVARSRLLVIAAEGLLRLGDAEPARAALEASRELPPAQPGEFGFERSDFRGKAAQVAARLEDHALAETLVEGDAKAQAELARHHAEAGDLERARGLLGATDPDATDLGWRLARAGALAGVGDREAALALAGHDDRNAALVHLVVARTLTAQGHRDDAATVLLAAIEGMPPTLDGWDRLSSTVAIAGELDEAGRRDAALELLERTREELRGHGDHFRALEIWASLIDTEHRLGKAEQAWADVEAFGKASLADVNAAPMTRVLLLTREGRLAEALAVIHDTAAITYPLAYAHVHARMSEPDAALERELDDGLRTFCP